MAIRSWAATGCARWLAWFESHLTKSPNPPLPPKLRTSNALLAEAVRLDPSDDIARQRIINRHSSYLEYTLHDLPLGVLYGPDGASANECEDLLGLLCAILVPVQILLIVFAMIGFRQAWNVEVEHESGEAAPAPAPA